jgi:hypothetical protein
MEQHNRTMIFDVSDLNACLNEGCLTLEVPALSTDDCFTRFTEHARDAGLRDIDIEIAIEEMLADLRAIQLGRMLAQRRRI